MSCSSDSPEDVACESSDSSEGARGWREAADWVAWVRDFFAMVGPVLPWGGGAVPKDDVIRLCIIHIMDLPRDGVVPSLRPSFAPEV